MLDLSLLTSEYGRRIHPCKGCASTAMPLCHWPCSCYPNHAMDQVDDWMAEIYERWTAAHGVIILTPVYWYQAPGVLKQMIDRMVCADGGNPDPTSTAGKDAQKAKDLELQVWSYPKHLAGRAYGLVVHGDVAGIEGVRRSLSDWLDWMGLIDAGFAARLDRMIGYYEPYASSHQALDRDTDVQEEVRQVARAVVTAVTAIRGGLLVAGGFEPGEPAGQVAAAAWISVAAAVRLRLVRKLPAAAGRRPDRLDHARLHPALVQHRHRRRGGAGRRSHARPQRSPAAPSEASASSAAPLTVCSASSARRGRDRGRRAMPASIIASIR